MPRARTERRKRDRARQKAVKQVAQTNAQFNTFSPPPITGERLKRLIDAGFAAVTANSEDEGLAGTLYIEDPDAAWAVDPWLWTQGTKSVLDQQRQMLGSQAPFAIYVCKDYQTSIFDVPSPGPVWPKMWHLSIKRKDRQPLDDNRWRILQQVKNTLVGEENEAVEVYPAESRLVDTANQIHLFCFADPEERWPFGFTERFVTNDPGNGAVQRPIEGTALTDLIEKED